MKLNINNFFIRTWSGLKKGLVTPTLTQNLLDFQNKPLIRIFRVLGGLNTLNLLGGRIIALDGLWLYFSLFWAFLFLVYHIYFSIHRYIYINKLLKSKDLEVRNSPLDQYSTLIARLIVCGKGACENATSVGVGLGLMLGADQFLKETGREALFTPLLGAALDKVFFFFLENGFKGMDR